MVFLSYHFADEEFVNAVYRSLRQRPYISPYIYCEDCEPSGFQTQLSTVLKKCDAFVLFVDKALGDTQKAEAQIASLREISASKTQIKKLLLVTTKHINIAESLPFFFVSACMIPVVSFDVAQATSCAEAIIKTLRLDNPFDVPLGYPFDYEKKIIEEYSEGNGNIRPERVEQGCPVKWPAVERIDRCAEEPNPVDETILGPYRKEAASISVDTRVGWRGENSGNGTSPVQLTFPEAGPREMLCYPCGNTLTVGLLVSGGIAPGINAVIESIVNRHTLYRDQHKQKHGAEYDLKILGYLEGFEGFIRREQSKKFIDLDASHVGGLSGRAGALLRTSRADELLVGETSDRYKYFLSVIDQLWHSNVEILYVIGGEGSMKAAHAIWKISRDIGKPVSVVGIPKTMDNDILWVWQSFGFLSAVQEARTAILNLHTEATSNPRLCIIQLFGSDSGFVVSHAALASGVCDAALIPEVHFAIKGRRGLSQYIREKLNKRLLQGVSPSALIVMAETAIPEDALDYVNDPEDKCQIRLFEKEKDAVREFFEAGRRIHGQTPDSLRAAALKIVSQTLLEDIHSMAKMNKYWKEYRVFTNEPRHLIRSIAPSVSDVIIGERLGALAVDNAMAGYTDFMVSQWLTEYVLVPLKLVILGRKRVPENGMFWKSVVASTGQPAQMV